MSTVRHLLVDLDGLDHPETTRPWRAPRPELAPIGQWGGTAAALVQAACGDAGLQLAVGPGIAHGLPTAGRASVFGRSPLTGRLAEGLRRFASSMRGYGSEEALMVGFETRSSSPVRIPRDDVSLQHLDLQRLFPCGEGAGYAGGIVSASLDGRRCAEALAASISI